MDTKTMQFPKTLIEATRQFSDLDHATMFFAAMRWPHGVECPHCGSKDVDYIARRRVWECRGDHSRRQFSVKIGTIFEECRLTIDKCLIAIWLEINAKNSISSYEIARSLGVTQKTGWFLLHRVRFALKQGSFEKMGRNGVPVEADESFIGGLAKNMHAKKKALKITGSGSIDKTAVMGLLERHSAKKHSTVRAMVLKQAPCEPEITEIIHKHVEPGAHVITDEYRAYRNLYTDFEHHFITHTEKYVEGIVHTNGLENFWSLLKRALKGTHVSVEPFHLAAYVDSEAFRFNHRKMNDGGRFSVAMPNMIGKRLTYKALIGDTGEYLASDNAGASEFPA
jgi:transposase-like protein